MKPNPQSEAAFRRLMQKVWQDDVAPLLRGKYAAQRATGARVGGKAGAGLGYALDRLFGFRGRPFQRSLGSLGATLGAVVPDAWDRTWMRDTADADDRKQVEQGVKRGAAALDLVQAAELLEIDVNCTPDELQDAWRMQAKRWHPDLAPAGRADEYRLRFIACQAAYERLRAARAAEPQS